MSCQTLRFADNQTVTQYPLPIAAPAPWLADGDGGWRCQIGLPGLRAGSIVIPSLSVLERPGYRFQFELDADDAAYPLPLVPAPDQRSERSPDPSNQRVRTAIDCFHVLDDLERATLKVRCCSGRAPERYLLTVAIRPVDLDQPCPPPDRDAACKPPPRFSQMLENPRHARRICSPVSVAMILGGFDPDLDKTQLIADCHDPVTRMYGLWPLAIRAASERGFIGAVEAFDGWAAVLAVLDAGLPVVASIRYQPGALPGSPMPATGGHLVVVHGVERQEVLVNDPASPDHGGVARRYPAEAFAEAWFRHRGAAYILLP